MDRNLFLTEDGSHSLKVNKLDETYHSKFGAIRESTHIFITNALLQCSKKHIRILEMGFGTGLNAFLSLLTAREKKVEIEYCSIEKYPLLSHEYTLLNFPDVLGESRELFLKLHESEWDSQNCITPGFKLKKIKADCRDISLESGFDLVFYDAFAPDIQPGLWEYDLLLRFYNALNTSGIFVTYSAKGEVRRSLIACGFTVERLKGPPGKREMIRAIK